VESLLAALQAGRSTAAVRHASAVAARRAVHFQTPAGSVARRARWRSAKPPAWISKEQSYFRKLPSQWIGLLFVVAFCQIFWLGAPHPVTYQSIILLMFSMNMGLAANSFGLDEPAEINRYLLFPLSGREILLGKNLGFAFIVAVQLSIMLPLASKLLAAKLVSVLALTALAYLGSLQFAGRKFERDWQKISYRLS